MPGDYSRFNDITQKQRSALLMQQGRVQLDSDWNEMVEILTTRDQFQSLDTFGRAAVPRATTPDAFKLTVDGADLRIGAGRMYVDGILVECFGTSSNPVKYSTQPFFPDPPSIEHSLFIGVVYLDVWKREVTAIEDDSLLDPALGDVDTATRLQTVWQARIAPGPAVCGAPVGTPSAGRLTVTPAPSTQVANLCQPPDTPGFHDIENRHYRVEIHDVSNSVVNGVVNSVTRYKYSREGASVVSRITRSDTVNSNSATRLTVNRIGRDAVLRFMIGNWVEITDDAHSLPPLTGTMAKVIDVDEGNLTITLDRLIAWLPSAVTPRVILWNQTDSDGVDSDGLLHVLTNQTVALERGLALKFSLDPAGGAFQPGDYWLFPARMADAMATPLTNAVPLPLHHYASLAALTLDAEGRPVLLDDCRILWPDCECCECAACVTPESHLDGSLTIQKAIEKVKKLGGGKVCLQPGTYSIVSPISIDQASHLSLVGHGNVLVLPNFPPNVPPLLIDILASRFITIENIQVCGGFFSTPSPGLVAITDCNGPVTITGCTLVDPSGTPAAGVVLQGKLSEVYLLRNCITAGNGVACKTSQVTTGGWTTTALSPTGALITTDVSSIVRFDDHQSPTVIIVGVTCVDLRARDNTFACKLNGILLEADAMAADIRSNTFTVSTESAVTVTGSALRAGAIVIEGNAIDCDANGIVAAVDDAYIANNSISRPAPPPNTGGGNTTAIASPQVSVATKGPGATNPDLGVTPGVPAPPDLGVTPGVPTPPDLGRPAGGAAAQASTSAILLIGETVPLTVIYTGIAATDGGVIAAKTAPAQETAAPVNVEAIKAQPIGKLQFGVGGAVGVGGSGTVTTLLPHSGRLHVVANRIAGVGGNGIRLTKGIASAIIQGNYITDAGWGGIVMDADAVALELAIDHNHLNGTGTIAAPAIEGSGIRIAGLPGTTGYYFDAAKGNTIGFPGGGTIPVNGTAPVPTTDVTILANRITQVSGHGIRLSGPLGSAMIKQNFIKTAGGGGIVMDDGGSAECLSIENNDIDTVGSAATLDNAAFHAAGIRVGNVGSGIIAENQIVSVNSSQAPVEGISCRGFTDVEVSGNTIAGNSSPYFQDSSDIFLAGTGARVMKNVVRRQAGVNFLPGISWPVLLAKGVTTLIAGSNAFETTDSLNVALVQITGGHCTFADNLCTAKGTSDSGNSDSGKSASGTAPPVTATIPVVAIGPTDSLIVTSNRVKGGLGVSFDLAAPGDQYTGSWTVLGNIADKPIRINTVRLPEPWAPFNRPYFRPA